MKIQSRGETAHQERGKWRRIRVAIKETEEIKGETMTHKRDNPVKEGERRHCRERDRDRRDKIEGVP